jgi:hypothetical protein
MPLLLEQVPVGCRTSKLVSLYDSISLSVDFVYSELREHALLAPQVLDGMHGRGNQSRLILLTIPTP